MSPRRADTGGERSASPDRSPQPRTRRRSTPVAWPSVQESPGGFTCIRDQLTFRVQALTASLWRLRFESANAPAPPPTEAVIRHEWPPVPTHVEPSRTQARLGTTAGTLTLSLATGGWEVRDCAGLPVFLCHGDGMNLGDGKPRLALALDPGDILFGLGETSGPLNKRGLVRELWNIDVLGHASAIHPGLRSMYVSIPFLLMLREGRAAGAFWDNSARQVWDLGAGQADRLAITADSGSLDLYLLLGPTPADVVGAFTDLTGRMPLPPRWGLGYHQSRHSYGTRRQLAAVAREFRRRCIPCDALYLDILHLDGHRVFTFGSGFPQPASLLKRLRRQGFKTVAIVDPGVKDDPRFGVLRRGRQLDAFVKDASGEQDFLGEVWPGRTRFPDFLNVPVREWWGREQSRLQALGVAGFWNDMNEPANYARPDKTLDPQCLHRTAHGPARHAAVHNLYGSAMAQASRAGAQTHRPDERPFIISRAGYAGIQRHALVWTGDNSSCWEHLADSIPLLLNLGLSGVAFCGSDVGGFLDDCNGELLARWTQLAAFTPFFRNHSNFGTRAQEPWAFGPGIEAICRQYIGLRYQLLPYLYGLFVEAHRHGTPIMRPLAWHFANDPTAVACSDQFLLGADLLVAPVLRPGTQARSVYLPAGNWYDFWTGRRFYGRQQVLAEAGLATLPLFVRAGALVPSIEVQPHTATRPPAVANLHVWPGGPGALNWYEDDGASLNFERGGCHERAITFCTRRRGGVLHFAPATGTFVTRVTTWRIIVRGATRRSQVRTGGTEVPARFEPEASALVFELPNRPGDFEVSWA